MPDQDKEVFTIEEVCRKLGVGRSTGYKSVKTGEIPSISRNLGLLRHHRVGAIARLHSLAANPANKANRLRGKRRPPLFASIGFALCSYHIEIWAWREGYERILGSLSGLIR